VQQDISKHRRSAIFGLFFLLLFVLSRPTHAATVTWNGGGANNLASTPANWSGGIVPRDDDAVIFNNTSTKNCTWDLYIIPSSLSLNPGYTGTVTLVSELVVTGDVTILAGSFITNNDFMIGIGGGQAPPSAPSALNATAVSSSHIDLSWIDNSNYETGFRIERKSGAGGTYNLLDTVGANVTTYPDMGLTAGTTYYYRVGAYNASGDSAYSNEANSTTITIPPTAITQSATNITGTSATLNATVNPNGLETTVYFEWGTTTAYGNSTSSHSAGNGITDIVMPDIITGLSPLTAYHYRVAAGNSAGTTYGSDVSFTTLAPISLTIDSPSDGATIYAPNVTVTGTVINAWGYETGVTMNGIVANVSRNQFTVNHVPLQEGTNVITATATDSYGRTATASITVTASTAGHYIRLTSDTESGVAPLEATLRIDGSFSITNSSMSVTSPVQPELLSSTATEYEYRMTTEGIYYFTATVPGPDGYVYQDTVSVTVMNQAQINNLLTGIWESMKSSLATQNIGEALNYFAGETRQLYNDIYTALYANLPQIVQEMQDIQLIYIKGNAAKYRIRKNELYGGQMLTLTYYIYFVVDNDGLWKIYRY
jgi:hypothetical protein